MQRNAGNCSNAPLQSRSFAKAMTALLTREGSHLFYCPFLSTIFHVQLGEVPKVSGERYSKEVEDSRLTAVQASSDEAKLKPFQQFTLNADNLQCFLAGEKKDIIKPQVATSIFCSVVKIGSLKLFGHKNGMARKEQGFPEEKKTQSHTLYGGDVGGEGKSH